MTTQKAPLIDLLAILQDIRDSGRPYTHATGCSVDDLEAYLNARTYDAIPDDVPKDTFMAHYFTHPSVAAITTPDSVRWMHTPEIIAGHTGYDRNIIRLLLKTRKSLKGTLYKDIDGHINIQNVIDVLVKAMEEGFLRVHEQSLIDDPWSAYYVDLRTGRDLSLEHSRKVEVVDMLRQAKSAGCRLNMGSFFSTQTINGKQRTEATLEDMIADKKAVGDLVAYVSLMPSFRAAHGTETDVTRLSQKVAQFLHLSDMQSRAIIFNLPIRQMPLSEYQVSWYPVAWKDVRFDHVIDVLLGLIKSRNQWVRQYPRVEWADFPEHIKKKRNSRENPTDEVHEGFADN